jgi:hypothetical protein
VKLLSSGVARNATLVDNTPPGIVPLIGAVVVPAGTRPVPSVFEASANFAACAVTATATQRVETSAARAIAILIPMHRSNTRDRTILRIDMGGFPFRITETY